MPVCGSAGGGETLWEWNRLPWEHFVENQCGGGRDTDRRPNLLGGEGRTTHRTLNFIGCLEFIIRP